MINDALFYQPYEIIGGEKIMAPASPLDHSSFIVELATTINLYLRQKKCGYVFTDDVDVHLPDGNVFQPDLVVVKKENCDILKHGKAIYGVPDMVVEVLSKSTRKRDVTVKKDAYEANGVKEYWIVDTKYKSIDVYVLHDGKFKFDNEYIFYSEDDVEWFHMSADDRAAVKSEISLSIFPDLTVKLGEIFSWGYDY